LDTRVDEVVQKAKEERAEIKIAEINKEIAKKNVELARGAYYTSLGAFFNYNTRESGMGRIVDVQPNTENPTREIGFVEETGNVVVTPNTVTTIGNPLPFFEQLQRNDGISYGVQLSIPIFNGLSTRNQVRRNQVNVKRAEYELEQTKLDLEANVYQAYVDADGAFEAYEAALVAANAQEQSFDYATQRFDVGLSNAFEFSEAKLRYENSQSEVLRTKYDYIFKLKVLELYFGVPVTALKF
jgi:outer membrane protein